MAHLSNDAPISDQGCPIIVTAKHLAKMTVHSNELEGFRQVGSFIVVSEQLIVCVQ
jgi:hypothetical protein